ncbi:MAG: hypothetical protein HRU70_08150 [Phycisphaeraceae bacterium]|nr:MAG: hypothetical protein HRU70_08150 [Phycisphaeraceae bacterium]
MLDPMGPELIRRWVAALLLVDRDEREAMVEMVERQVTEMYAAREQRPRSRPSGGQRPA